MVALGCGGGSAPAEPVPTGNVRLTITVSGSGGVGYGVDVRVDSQVVRVRPDSPAGLELSPGTYDMVLEAHPEWCRVTMPSTLHVPSAGTASLDLVADCVGGILYETSPGSVHRVELRTITPEGFDAPFTNLRRGRHELLAWSPDGRQVAVATRYLDDPPRLVLWDIEARGFDEIPFDGTTGHYGPAWSPDSQKLAFTLGESETQGRLMLAHRDGSGAVPLLPGTADDAAAAWSPDGRRIAFATSRTRRYRTLHVVNPDGSGLTELDDRGAQAISWSSDGQWIAYNREATIAVIRPSGAGLILVESGPLAPRPRWSPARNVIGFVLDEALHTYDLESDTRVVIAEASIGGWSWSPDGEWIVFSDERFGADSELRVVRRDGTDERTILTRDARISDVLWDPTASR